MQFLTLNIGLFLGLLWCVRIKGEPDWTFEVLEINCTNNTPDLFDFQMYLKRIARGRFVIDGSITINTDLTDEAKVYSDLFYSPTAQHFVRNPLNIPQMTISKYINTFYKDLVLECFKECATHPPITDKSDTFIPPLTKRVMILENCTFTNDDMPSHMRPGYYLVIFVFTNQVETTVTFLIKIESK